MERQNNNYYVKEYACKDSIGRFYDFDCNCAGVPYITKCVMRLGTETSGDRKIRVYKPVSDITQEYPQNTNEMIWTVQELRDEGYCSWTEAQPDNFGVDSNNLITKVKLGYLSLKNRLLECVYDDKAQVQGMNVVALYVHYINALTGEQYVTCIGTQYYSPELVAKLQVQGYHSIEDTFLMEHIGELNTSGQSVMINGKLHQDLQR